MHSRELSPMLKTEVGPVSSSRMKYLKELLNQLGFQKYSGEIWRKTYCKNRIAISVDFQIKKIVYPEQIKLGDKTTSNLQNDENFVVLECIDRLLEKGYSADRIELEKK